MLGITGSKGRSIVIEGFQGNVCPAGRKRFSVYTVRYDGRKKLSSQKVPMKRRESILSSHQFAYTGAKNVASTWSWKLNVSRTDNGEKKGRDEMLVY